MPRDFEVYLEDIRQAIGKIESYTAGLTRDAFDPLKEKPAKAGYRI